MRQAYLSVNVLSNNQKYLYTLSTNKIMKKKSSLYILIGLITLFLVISVIIIFPLIARNLGGKFALKTAAARDIALTLDTIYAYSYDIELEYDFDLSDFVVEISENIVKIHEQKHVVVIGNNLEGSDPVPGKYNFVPVNDKPNFVLDKPKKLVFKKENDILTVIGIT